MIKRIVLTGGPCAGKTTILSKIEQALSEIGYKVFIVRESATELIGGGITPHENGVGIFNFQKLILLYQYQKEELYNKAINESKDENIVIIYDRGILDNKAYISDLEFDMILEDLSLEIGRKIDEMDLVSRYDMVIHLVTSAGNRGYSLENNKARYESENEAILLDRRTMNSWIMHNNLHIIDSTDDFNIKVNKVLSLIHNCLGEETLIKRERKFLVDAFFDSELIDKLNGVVSDIEQYYIKTASDEYECRVRKTNYKFGINYYYVIQKIDGLGGKRILEERKINEKEFDRLISFNVISSLKKKRISFTYNKHFYKLDILNNGLMVLEVIVDMENGNIIIPECFSVLREVTYDENYKNINLGADSVGKMKKKIINK